MTVVEEFLLHDARSIDDIGTREGHTVSAASWLWVWITDAECFDNLGVRISECGISESAHSVRETLEDVDRVIADGHDAQAACGEIV